MKTKARANKLISALLAIVMLGLFAAFPLTALADPPAPTISTQPQNKSVTAGQTAEFKVVAAGTAPLAYQWEFYHRDGVWLEADIAGYSGKNTPTLKVMTTDTSLNGRRLRCVVSNAGGTVTSNEAIITVTAAMPPAAPSKLTATAGGTGGITLNWQDNSNNETGFVIEKREGGGGWYQTDSVGANVTTYRDANMQAGKTYIYRVNASSANGYSPYSNEASITITAAMMPPAAPSSLTATAGGTGGITLNWQDNSNNETGFVIEKREGSGGWYQTDSVGANVTTYRDANMQAGKTYTYRVNASSANGYSPYSNEASVSIPAAAYEVTVNPGTGSGSYVAGQTVTITANAAPAGKVFDKWTTSSGVAFANASGASTTFTMPSSNVTVTATYRDLPGATTATTTTPAVITPPAANTAMPESSSPTLGEDAPVNEAITGSVGDENEGGFNWLWILFIGLAGVAVGGVATVLNLRQKT
jgi:hypothetical protein